MGAHGKRHSEGRARNRAYRKSPAELARKVPHELETQTLASPRFKPHGQSNTVVADQKTRHTRLKGKAQMDLTGRSFGKAMLESITQKLIHHQGRGNRLIDINLDRNHVEHEGHGTRRSVLGVHKLGGEASQVLREIDPREVPGPVEHFV